MRDHPADLSPDERRQEIVAILAAGLLRLRRRPHLAVHRPKPKLEHPVSLRLEVPRETALSVHPG